MLQRLFAEQRLMAPSCLDLMLLERVCQITGWPDLYRTFPCYPQIRYAQISLTLYNISIDWIARFYTWVLFWQRLSAEICAWKNADMGSYRGGRRIKHLSSHFPLANCPILILLCFAKEGLWLGSQSKISCQKCSSGLRNGTWL